MKEKAGKRNKSEFETQKVPGRVKVALVTRAPPRARAPSDKVGLDKVELIQRLGEAVRLRVAEHVAQHLHLELFVLHAVRLDAHLLKRGREGRAMIGCGDDRATRGKESEVVRVMRKGCGQKDEKAVREKAGAGVSID